MQTYVNLTVSINFIHIKLYSHEELVHLPSELNVYSHYGTEAHFEVLPTKDYLFT